MSDPTSNPVQQLHNTLYTEMHHVNTLILERLQSKVELVEQVGKHLVLSGGKRIRPLLTLACSRLFQEFPGFAIHLAAAVELIHTATLLHDDVVDDSHMRRGEKTANDVWGNNASVLVGDFLFSRAFQLMVETRNLDVLASLSNAAARITEGEVLQLTSAYSLDLSVETYLEIISSKTAALFASACEVGGMIAGMDPMLQNDLYEFGHSLGMMFQIRDDVLDYLAVSSDSGKERGCDFMEGKVTLPVILAYQNGLKPSFWKNHFEGELENNQSDLKTAVSILENNNIFEACHKIAHKYHEKALQSINKFPKTIIWNDLKKLIAYSLNRQS
ncbi:MAG: polyprenyl synthetase family protein [Alphaproteobacteria bacterium]|nr:polyprenyl synthetase family protein [Alphaproteobacteria bacterium]